MTREEQDKIWAELSEEKQKSAREMYKQIKRPLDPAKSNTQTEANVMAFALETTYGSHNLQPKQTYEDVARELFKDDYYYYDHVYDRIIANSGKPTMPMACTSQNQVRKLCAINQLLNVAKFLNKNEDGTDWMPDWDKITESEYEIFGIGIDPVFDEVRVFPVNPDRISTEPVYFRTKKIAKQAIEILGKETIRTALGNY